jgi:hypothetical protein
LRSKRGNSLETKRKRQKTMKQEEVRGGIPKTYFILKILPFI